MSDSQAAIKESINLPKTSFPMKANLANKEPQIIENWNKVGIYHKMVDQNKGKQSFTMPDGPPYANGNIHMGHTLNKCLKDFVIKYKNMSGKHSPYIPGWDCHGLPIEHNITKKLGGKIREKTDKEVRLMCREEANKWVAAQKEQFIRLGILGEWENPYLTLNPDYEAEEVREFSRILKNGTLFQGQKPVYWCIPLQTALAEAEIEYQDHSSPSIYVRFPYTPNAKFGNFNKPVSCVIWTTTPWTIPANQGICLHPDFEYGFFEQGDEIILIAKEMQEFFEQDTEIKLKAPTQFFKGSEFEGEKALHPLFKRSSTFVLGDHVTLETGTGCVHTAPGHGQEDYIVGLQYNLEVLSPVGPDGKFTKEVPEYEGIKVWDANEKIVEDLKAAGKLVSFKKINHSYPHCWRSKSPLIFRATAQWFISMDNEKYNIRKKALAELENINFVPDWGVKRLTSMIENRPDWCISRQRNWGVPLPVFYCKKCEEPYLNHDSIEKVALAMEKGPGIEAYYDTPIEEFIEPNTKCSECGSTEFKKGRDILDVWFDSGICHSAVQKKREGLTFPADLYLEGSDQHRGWFQTSLLTSIASTGQSPFKTLLTHNFVNDDKGRKMSKSLGNVVDPLKLIKNSGAELLRLWTASQDYGQDMNYSNQGFQRVTESYRRLRNTMRFLLGNIGDFDFSKDAVEYKDLLPLDQWILDRFYLFMVDVEKNYEDFEFYKVYHALNNFFAVDLSNHYLDIIKDRLYTAGTDSLSRRSCQTVVYELASNLIKLMAPLTSFLSEESYSHFQGAQMESVFLESYPKPHQQWENKAIREDFSKLFEIRSVVTKESELLRAAKTIGSSLEASVRVKVSKSNIALLEKYAAHMREFFIVSEVSWEDLDDESLKELGFIASADIKNASGEKCSRCWHYADLQDLHPFGKICPKCIEALK